MPLATGSRASTALPAPIPHQRSAAPVQDSWKRRIAASPEGANIGRVALSLRRVPPYPSTTHNSENGAPR
jgi:hypothetical protein